MKAKLGGAAGRIGFCLLPWKNLSFLVNNKFKRIITNVIKSQLCFHECLSVKKLDVYLGKDFLLTRRLQIAKKCHFGGNAALSK